MRCMKCNNVEANPNLLMACDSCSYDIHKKCFDLNASEIRVIDLKGPRKLKFFCNDCHNGLSQVPKILKDIDDLKSAIVSLKNAKPTASSDYCQSEDALLSEIHDRFRRSNNVFNVPESNNDMKSATDIFNKLPKQREHETKIKDELKSRTSNGENVTLKYLNRTPHQKTANIQYRRH
ncbi:hypothetical protein JTB14_010125 [Gonioctena quinquepunctata]|nr:hypothetical protein JTB14_010125 [Gonioctena quinquepunctata]